MKVKIIEDVKMSKEEVEIRLKAKDLLDSCTLESLFHNAVVGIKSDKTFLLNYDKITAIYSEDKKVWILGNDKEVYESKLRVYMFSERVPDYFVSVSAGVIINLNQVNYFEQKNVKEIIVVMQNGYSTYVSRRHIKQLKERIKTLHE